MGEPFKIQDSPFRFFIYSGVRGGSGRQEHNPPHCHVKFGKGDDAPEIRIKLGRLADEKRKIKAVEPWFYEGDMKKTKMSGKQAYRALQLVTQHQKELIKEWTDVNGWDDTRVFK